MKRNYTKFLLKLFKILLHLVKQKYQNEYLNYILENTGQTIEQLV